MTHHHHSHHHHTTDTIETSDPQHHLRKPNPMRRYSSSHPNSVPHQLEPLQLNEHHEKEHHHHHEHIYTEHRVYLEPLEHLIQQHTENNMKNEPEHHHINNHHEHNQHHKEHNNNHETDPQNEQHKDHKEHVNSHHIRRYSVKNQHLDGPSSVALSDDNIKHLKQHAQSEADHDFYRQWLPHFAHKPQHHDTTAEHHFHLLPHIPIQLPPIIQDLHLPEHNHNHKSNPHQNSVMRMFGNYKHRNDGV